MKQQSEANMSFRDILVLGVIAITSFNCVSSQTNQPSNLCPDSKLVNIVPYHLVPGMTFNITNTTACPLLKPNGLVMGNYWPIKCSPTFSCITPLNVRLGLQPIKLNNRTLFSVPILAPLQFAVVKPVTLSGEEDPIVISFSFPWMKRDWQQEADQKMRLYVYDYECLMTQLSTNMISCQIARSDRKKNPQLYEVVLILVAGCIYMAMIIFCIWAIFGWRKRKKKGVVEPAVSKSFNSKRETNEVQDHLNSFTVYCSKMVLMVNPSSRYNHVFLAPDLKQKEITRDMQAVNMLLKEVIFISSVRDLCDNSIYDLDICQEMAAIIVLANQEDGEGFAQLLSYIFEAEAQKLKHLSPEDLDDAHCVKKTPFVVYLAVYWLCLTVYKQFHESSAMRNIYNIYSHLINLADQSYHDDSLGVGEYMVAKIHPPYSFQTIKLAKKDSLMKSYSQRPKPKQTVTYRTTDSLDILRHLIIEARYSKLSLDTIPKSAKLKLKTASLKMDLEEQLTRSDCTLQTYQIPNCVEVHLAEANQLPYGKDNLNWSVLKCTDKLAESYGLSFSDICRPYPDTYVPFAFKLMEEDDKKNQYTRKLIQSEVKDLLKNIYGQNDNPIVRYIAASIDYACNVCHAPSHISEYLKEQIFLKHFWVHILQDPCRVFDFDPEVDMPKVVLRNMQLISEIFRSESHPNCRRMRKLFLITPQETTFRPLAATTGASPENLTSNNQTMMSSQVSSDNQATPTLPSKELLVFPDEVRNKRRLLSDALVFVQRAQDDFENIFEEIDLDDDDEHVYTLLLSLFKDPKKMKKDRKKRHKKKSKKSKKHKKKHSKKGKRKRSESEKRSKKSKKSNKSEKTTTDEVVTEEADDRGRRKSSRKKRRKSKRDKKKKKERESEEKDVNSDESDESNKVVRERESTTESPTEPTTKTTTVPSGEATYMNPTTVFTTTTEAPTKTTDESPVTRKPTAETLTMATATYMNPTSAVTSTTEEPTKTTSATPRRSTRRRIRRKSTVPRSVTRSGTLSGTKGTTETPTKTEQSPNPSKTSDSLSSKKKQRESVVSSKKVDSEVASSGSDPKPDT